MSDTWTAFAELQDASFDRATAVTRASFPVGSRLGAGELRAVLSATRHLVVSTTRPDGRPHSAMSSFTCHDRAFWLPASAGTVRVRNLERTPYAALVIAGVATVTTEGTVTITAAPPDGVTAAYGRDTGWVSLWIRVEPERLFSYRDTSGA